MAHQPHNVRGKRVPSVTTITGRFGNKKGLIFWANQVGLGIRDCDEQEPCAHCGRRPGKTQDEASKKAREVGDLGHAMIEAEVKGKEVNWPTFAHLDEEQRSMAEDCLEAFHRWIKNAGVEFQETELSITSERYLYGGTLDAIGWVDDKFCLIDWKTSRGLYSDYLAQLAGYLILVEDAGMPPIDEIHILRVAKESAAFEHRYFPRRTFDPAIDWFLQARDLYEKDKALERLMR